MFPHDTVYGVSTLMCVGPSNADPKNMALLSYSGGGVKYYNPKGYKYILI